MGWWCMNGVEVCEWGGGVSMGGCVNEVEVREWGGGVNGGQDVKPTPPVVLSTI